ncbi:MAG: two-component regulator propeller domain-containing protein, partial [Bacteroidota bacterium]
MITRIIIIILCFFSPAKAQELISTAQGLSNRWATCLVQDDAGMMWIGTINGLNRYDGYETKPYFTPQISNNNVICLLKDRSGLLWAGTGNGLNSIDVKTGNIVKITHPDQRNTLVVRSIFQRASGQIIICDQNGMVFTVTNTNQLVPLVKIPDVTATTNKLPSPVDYIKEDKNKVLWFITEFGFIYRYDGKTLVSKNVMPTRIKYDYPKTLHIISTDTLLVGSRYSGLYYYAFRYNKRYTTPFLDSLNRISKLVYVTAEQEKDHYWITYVDLKVMKVNLAQNTML